MTDEKGPKEPDFAAAVEHFSGLAVKIFGFVAGTVGLLYAIGFAVVNISLLSYGVYEVALVRARYVSAGVSYLVLFTVLVGGTLVSLAIARLIVEKLGWPSWLRLPLSLIPIWYVCRFLAGGVWEFRGPYDPNFMTWCLGVSALVFVVAQKDEISRLIRIASYAAWFLVGIFLLVLVYYYGHSAYATFPPALGGGLPIVVQFSGDEESLATLDRLGIEREGPSLTKKVDLIAQTDNKYIVLITHPDTDQGVAVSFEKSFAHSIRYFPEAYYLSDEYSASKYTEEGQDRLKHNRPDSAIRKFDDAIRRYQKHTPAYLGKGDAYIVLRNYEEAINCFEQANEVEIEDTPLKAQAYYGLARAYALRGDPEETLNWLGRTIDIDPEYKKTARTEEAFDDDIRLDDEFINLIFQGWDNAAAWYGQAGDKYREEENWEAAKLEYTWAISITAKDTDDSGQIKNPSGKASYHYRLAEVYMELDRYSDALAECTEAAELEPDNATYRFCIAEAHAALDDFESARRWFEEARTINPEYTAAWIREGDAYLALEQNQIAGTRYAEAIRLDPNNSKAYYGRARAQARLGLSAGAMEDLRRAISLNPEYVNTAKLESDFKQIYVDIEPVLSAAEHNQMGNLRAGEGKLEEAIEEYKQALKLDSTNAIYHANLGDTYRQLQRLGDAAEQYQFAVTYAPENDSYHHRLAGAFYEQGRFDKAIEEYQAALAIEEKALHHSGLGDAYRQADSLDKAAEAYARAIELDETNASYHARLADVYHRQGRLEDAVSAYSEAINRDDANPTYHYGLAQAFQAQDKLEEAIQAYQAAIERNLEYGAAYCGLGLAYQKSQQREEAIQALRRCQELSQDAESSEQAEMLLRELGAP